MIYITKYALTVGISPVDRYERNGGGGLTVRNDNGTTSYYRNGEWAEDREDAIGIARACLLYTSISQLAAAEKADSQINLEALAEFAKATFGSKRIGWRDAMANKAIILPLLLDIMAPMDVLRNADKLDKLDHLFRRALDLDTPENPVFVHLSFLSAPVEDAEKPALAIEITPALPPIPDGVRDSNPHLSQTPAPPPEQS